MTEKYLAIRKFRFVNKVCKLENQAMSPELKLLEKVQKQEGSETMNQRDLEV